MKSEDLFDAIGKADDTMIINAKTPPTKKRSYKKPIWISAIAATLTLAIVLGVFLMPRSPAVMNSYALAEAKYPGVVPYSEDNFSNWRIDNQERDRAFYDLGVNIDSFLYKTIGEFLLSAEGDNAVYSPLNVYMAFAMLAEVTDTNSRQQILDVLGTDRIETLRKEAAALWQANYSDDGLVTSILASSVWLSDHYTYKKETMEKLAEIYYASSFSGQMGSEEYNQVLRSWLNEQTGNMLTDSVEQIEMNTETIMALATTIYFKARWLSEFSENNTETGIFYAPSGNVSCEYMKEIGKNTYYWGENFTAVQKELGSGEKNSMWFILPNEGTTPEELLSDSEAISFLLSCGKWQNRKEALVHFSVPKFDVTSDIDLKKGMQNLGITDVFSSELSDFSPMTDDRDDIFVSSAEHSARVTIDEEGCTATAFTVITMATESGVDTQIDFTLDRPFLFTITSDVGLPLFVGIVNQPK